MKSYYAHIENNIVAAVEAVTDDFFLANPNRYVGLWIKIGTENYPYCGIGDIYLPDNDLLISPQPFPSWILNGTKWEPPQPYPSDGNKYYWDENETKWIVFLT